MSFSICFPSKPNQTDSKEFIAHLFDVVLGDGIVTRVEYFELTKKRTWKHYIVHTNNEFTSVKCDNLIEKIKQKGFVRIVYNAYGNYYKVRLHRCYVRVCDDVELTFSGFPSFSTGLATVKDPYTEYDTYMFNIVDWHPIQPEYDETMEYPTDSSRVIYGVTSEDVYYRFVLSPNNLVYSYYHDASEPEPRYHIVGVVDLTDDIWTGDLILYDEANIRNSIFTDPRI
jgi:hypothetical protein